MRRLRALVFGLPPEAVTWRSTGFAPAEELLAQLLEQDDAWMRHALLPALMGAKKVRPPPPPVIVRPGQEPPPARRIETDPRRIAAFFAQHMKS